MLLVCLFTGNVFVTSADSTHNVGIQVRQHLVAGRMTASVFKPQHVAPIGHTGKYMYTNELCDVRTCACASVPVC